MNEIKIPGLDIDWAKLFSDLQTTGLDLGLNLLAAIALLVWATHIVRTGVLRLYGANLRHVISRSVGNRVQALLAGISAADFATYATAMAAAGVITLLGSVLPAWRAMRVDPVAAMRTE